MNVISRIADALQYLNDILLGICRYLIIIIVAVLAVILFSAVVWRYGLNSAISWSEEGSKYLMVWLTFLGTPIALRRFAHINIDLLAKAMPARIQQALHFIVSVIIIFTMSIVFWKGVEFSQLGMRQVASSFNLSMLYMYIAVPIGSALTCLVALEHAARALAGIINPELGLDDQIAVFDDELFHNE
jgi:TRAP-type C4-dicarboxylate transport system permease small subunit